MNEGNAPKVTALTWVRPPALGRAVAWLLRQDSEVRVITHKGHRNRFNRLAHRWRPRLVLVSAELLVRDRGDRVLPALKRSTPGSKLVLICSWEGFASEARRWGADACLETDVLIQRLLPTVRKLMARPHRKRRGS